ncbi:uncharacterized protein VNE69_04114 [Vairimorpha necatrix]|uniref:Uncharacterized protein n=1 Tax=Vairimorpha necatrix TaxID=6039 RepID=A0AAX4JBE6_9MICR
MIFTFDFAFCAQLGWKEYLGHISCDHVTTNSLNTTYIHDLTLFRSYDELENQFTHYNSIEPTLTGDLFYNTEPTNKMNANTNVYNIVDECYNYNFLKDAITACIANNDAEENISTDTVQFSSTYCFDNTKSKDDGIINYNSINKASRNETETLQIEPTSYFEGSNYARNETVSFICNNELEKFIDINTGEIETKYSCDSNKTLKDEMEIYFCNDDIEKNIDIENIALELNSFIVTNDENLQRPENFREYSQLSQDSNYDQSLDFRHLRNQLSECKNKIENFIDQKKKIIITGYEKITTNIKSMKSHEHVFELYIQISKISQSYLYYLKKRQLPRIKNEIIALRINFDIGNLILEFIRIFEFFLTVYDMKKKIAPNKKISNKYRIKIHNYNIGIFSVFNYIPIIEIFESLKQQMSINKSLDYNLHVKIVKIIGCLRGYLFNLSSRTKYTIKLYNELNRIYNIS